MAKGVKLDLFVGADFSDGWSEVVEASETKLDQIVAPNKHFLVFKREKRNGKVVTLVGEFHLKKDEREALLKDIKKTLGCGGTYKDGFMEFQGELQDKLRSLLETKTFRFKK